MASLLGSSGASEEDGVVRPVSLSPRPTSFRSGVAHKFKFLTGQEKINHDCVYNLRPKILTSDTSPMACSETWFAVPYEGGGGPVFVSKVDACGKVEPTTEAVVNGHKGPVYSVDFSPFHHDVLATGGDDAKVNVWNLKTGDPQDATQQLLEGTHTHGVRDVAFHPSVASALASTAADGDAILWNVETSQVARKWKLGVGSSCLDWSYDGSLLLASCRDRKLRAYDLRASNGDALAFEIEPHPGSSKSFRAKSAFVGGINYIVSAGNPARKGGREVVALDLRSSAKEAPLLSKAVDSQNGAMLPHFDDTTGILWLWGRGDTTVRHIELKGGDDDSTMLSMTLGHEFRTGSAAGPHVGFAAMPARALDVANLQVAKFLRLTSTTVESVAFTLPRTPELKAYFNDDVYGDARTREPATDLTKWLLLSQGDDDQKKKIRAPEADVPASRGHAPALGEGSRSRRPQHPDRQGKAQGREAAEAGRHQDLRAPHRPREPVRKVPAEPLPRRKKGRRRRRHRRRRSRRRRVGRLDS